jgi:tetratricopeptide (TPR) repeat protein
VLFSHDIKNAPNSVIVTANVASSYIDMSNVERDSVKRRDELYKGVALLKHALTFHTTYVIGYFNLGLAYFKLGEADSAKKHFDVVLNYYPKYPRLGEFYYNLGVYYYLHQRMQPAAQCWQTTLLIDPQNKDAINALHVIGAPVMPLKR